MKFYIESNDDCYVAGWEEIASIEGIGKTPHVAISNLRKELKRALSNNALLEKVGHSIIETVLDEIGQWEEYREIAEYE